MRKLPGLTNDQHKEVAAKLRACITTYAELAALLSKGYGARYGNMMNSLNHRTNKIYKSLEDKYNQENTETPAQSIDNQSVPQVEVENNG